MQQVIKIDNCSMLTVEVRRNSNCLNNYKRSTVQEYPILFSAQINLNIFVLCCDIQKFVLEPKLLHCTNTVLYVCKFVSHVVTQTKMCLSDASE